MGQNKLQKAMRLFGLISQETVRSEPAAGGHTPIGILKREESVPHHTRNWLSPRQDVTSIPEVSWRRLRSCPQFLYFESADLIILTLLPLSNRSTQTETQTLALSFTRTHTNTHTRVPRVWLACRSNELAHDDPAGMLG